MQLSWFDDHITLAVMLNVKYPLSLMNVEDFSPNAGSSAMRRCAIGGTGADCAIMKLGTPDRKVL